MHTTEDHDSTLLDNTADTELEPLAKLYCYCHGSEKGSMIGCDNPECHHEWFHYSCLNTTSKPMSDLWYCPDCRKLPQFQGKSKRTCTIQIKRKSLTTSS